MEEIIKVNQDNMTVSGRDLHEALGIKERFSLWAERQKAVFGEEITTVGVPTEVHNNGGIQIRELEDFIVSIDNAKHICLMSKTEKGKECRQYLIDLEKAWNTPEQVMARALRLADHTINNLTAQLNEMRPKADYFDELVDRKLNTSFRDTAKELGIKEKVFMQFLKDKRYIYKDGKGELRPYADKNKGLFVLKEYNSTYSDHAGIQTLITPKGRETFRLLIKDLEGADG